VAKKIVRRYTPFLTQSYGRRLWLGVIYFISPISYLILSSHDLGGRVLLTLHSQLKDPCLAETTPLELDELSAVILRNPYLKVGRNDPQHLELVASAIGLGLPHPGMSRMHILLLGST